MRAIITININNVLNKVSKTSMIKAAKRWNVEFFEITKSDPKFLPYYLKLCIFDITHYNEILLLDGDCIVSNTCPNPFDLFYNKLLVVDGAPKRLINYDGIIDHINRESKFYNTIIPKYFNSGVMLINRDKHKQAFDYAKTIYNDDLEWHDQTPLNIALQKYVKEFADETWNYIPQTSNDLTKNIYHFAGYINKNEHINEYGKLLNIFNGDDDDI